MKIITIISTKGGVGKTTLTANLGALLADQGQRVLLVDADVQPTMSKYFQLERQSPAGLTALAMGAWRSRADLSDLISRISPGLDIIVSDDPAGNLQQHLLTAPDRCWRLHRPLRLPAVAANYDLVLIDTQGAVGSLQDAAVLAAHRLLSPITTEVLSAREFVTGTRDMLKRLDVMADSGLPTGPLTGILYRMDRTRDARDVALALQGLNQSHNFGTPDISVLEGVAIPSSVLWREAATAQQPIHRYAPRSASAGALVNLAQALFPELDFSAFAVEGV